MWVMMPIVMGQGKPWEGRQRRIKGAINHWAAEGEVISKVTQAGRPGSRLNRNFPLINTTDKPSFLPTLC